MLESHMHGVRKAIQAAKGQKAEHTQVVYCAAFQCFFCLFLNKELHILPDIFMSAPVISLS